MVPGAANMLNSPDFRMKKSVITEAGEFISLSLRRCWSGVESQWSPLQTWCNEDTNPSTSGDWTDSTPL